MTATGLPKPAASQDAYQADAVRLAKFASNCLSSFLETIKTLEQSLGPDTYWQGTAYFVNKVCVTKEDNNICPRQGVDSGGGTLVPGQYIPEAFCAVPVACHLVKNGSIPQNMPFQLPPHHTNGSIPQNMPFQLPHHHTISGYNNSVILLDDALFCPSGIPFIW